MVAKSKDFVKNIENLIYEKKQVYDKKVDITVKKIKKIKDRGKLDFGGSEYKKAAIEEIKTEKKKPDDEYGWWVLDEGVHLVEFNEEIDEEVIIQSNLRLQTTGSFIPAQIKQKDEDLENLLIVSKNGLDIKENARIASIFKI
ncbi:MAG: dCTP deaminase [Candidatus Thermoplasmatota archaeon]